MRVVCHGANPAGVYLAVLLKLARTSDDIVLVGTPPDERCDALVMSSLIRPPRALADPALAASIDEMTVHCDKLRVSRDGRTTTTAVGIASFLSHGRLTATLLARARAVGCQVVAAMPTDAGAADLVIISDRRNARRAQAGPEGSSARDAGGPRWLACDVEGRIAEPALLTKPTSRGVLHALLLPTRIDGGMLLLATATGKQRSGDSAAAEVRASLEAFADDLPELSVRTRVEVPSLSFVQRAWRTGNSVLLGDAAYMTDPSLGLDARQSLEDAEVLANLLATTSSVPDALEAFESMRRPMAESLLRADAANRVWLDNLQRYMAMPFEQFVYAAATRTMRINHTDVQRADPDLAATVEANVSGSARARSGRPPPPMFAPIALRGLTIPNRIAVSPMCMYNADDGTVGDFQLVHYGSRATGGVGLILTEMTDVSPEGRISPECAGLWKAEHVPAWKRVVDYVHTRTPAKIGVQLGHAGRKGSVKRSWERGALEPERAWETIAPSPIAFDKHYTLPRELDRADMDRVVAAYVAATRMADEAGFDMIEVHLAHGYLLSSFISPLSNKRTDAYGGTLNCRLRFPLEVFEAVRAAWPADRPISTRISAFDWIEGGTSVADAIEIARALKAAGNDIVAVSTGGITAERRPNVGRLYQGTFSDQVRNEAKVATMTVGGVASHGDANMMIAAGRADMCALARGFMYDPYYPLHAAQQQGYHDLAWANEYRPATSLRMRDLW